MVDIKNLMANLNEMKSNIKARNLNIDVNEVTGSYQKWVAQQQLVEGLQQKSNLNAKSMRSATDSERVELKSVGSDLKKQITLEKELLEEYKLDLERLVSSLPNWSAIDTPTGLDDSENILLRKYLEPKKFDFDVLDHMQLGENLKLIDFASGAKVAGSKFYFLCNQAVALQQALKLYAFKIANKHGFSSLATPDLARNEILQGVGFAPRGSESNTYEIKDTDLSLVATAEITVGGMHANEILPESKLPLCYVAESHCFRKESGAAGRVSKGLYRVHQFEKVEMYVISKPEESEKMLDLILQIEEEIYKGLEIPYRVMRICAGDLGAPAYKKYDIEAWMPGLGKYGEVTSASNCTCFQARRLKIRYKDESGRNKFVHTLNGTAIALSRTILAIMENYQQVDGSILVPEVLQPYLGFNKICAL